MVPRRANEEVALPGVAVDDAVVMARGYLRAATFVVGDAVEKWAPARRRQVFPGGDLDLLIRFGLLVEADLAKKRLADVVEVSHVVRCSSPHLLDDQARSSMMKRSGMRFKNAMIWSRSVMKSGRSSTMTKIDGSGVKVTVGPVRPRGAGPVTFNLPCSLPPSLNDILVVITVAVDFEQQFRRQRVHDRGADAVQTTRDLVTPAPELAARVQRRVRYNAPTSRVLRVFVGRMPRPSSVTRQLPSARSSSILVQTPCLVDGVVEPVSIGVVPRDRLIRYTYRVGPSRVPGLREL